MIHKYRKKVPIEAERFDGSKEMINKYKLDAGDTGFGREYYLDTSLGCLALGEGDWILTDHNRDHWACLDKEFRQEFERCD